MKGSRPCPQHARLGESISTLPVVAKQSVFFFLLDNCPCSVGSGFVCGPNTRTLGWDRHATQLLWTGSRIKVHEIGILAYHGIASPHFFKLCVRS